MEQALAEPAVAAALAVAGDHAGWSLLPLATLDWQQPWWLALALPALLWLLWVDGRSQQPMPDGRRRALLVTRAVLVVVGLAALAGPARELRSDRQAVVMVLDHSLSMGEEGLERVMEAGRQLERRLPSGVDVGWVAAGARAEVMAAPGVTGAEDLEPWTDWMAEHGGQTDLAAALRLAGGLFPAGTSRHVVLLTDGLETRGNLRSAAAEAAVRGIQVHAVPVAGEPRPDARITGVTPSQARLHEGAALAIRVGLESSLAGEGRLRLFENGLEVERRMVELEPGAAREEVFRRTPDRRNVYHFRAVLEDVEGDSIPDNNEGLAVVDVRGRPVMLFVEGEEGEGRYLVEAMAREGIRLESRPPQALPGELAELAGFDAVILSDVPATRLSEASMVALRDYVDQLGGGLVMIGGQNSFGVGGYAHTPVEDILPVRLQAPDQEEQQSAAVAIVVDRSGSMAGERLEFCKIAAAGVVELLGRKDYVSVIAFDTEAYTIVPMTRVTSTGAIISQINTLTAGGGTNMYPGMARAREELNQVNARLKHMIVLGDGQSAGTGYEALAAQCRAEGITVSTVSVGEGSWVALMQAIAAGGGGQGYVTTDAASLTRIFTQDTLTHTGRMIREQPFEAAKTERHPMLADWDEFDAPPLLGYVKTIRKPTAQVPLVTDLGDPLLAHWRFGLGKVTAFTSDAKSRWASLWVAGWPGYAQLWAQVLRETARPPQGRNMDLSYEWDGERAELTVDLLQDPGTRRDAAKVEADVFFAGGDRGRAAAGTALEPLVTLSLPQRGPGLYQGSFRPEQPGVYLIRARAGAQMVSAGLVHQPSTEAATGLTDDALLEEVTTMTGGGLIDPANPEFIPAGASVADYQELRSWLLGLFLLLFLADVMIRRWDHVRGLAEWLGQAPARLGGKAG